MAESARRQASRGGEKHRAEGGQQIDIVERHRGNGCDPSHKCETTPGDRPFSGQVPGGDPYTDNGCQAAEGDSRIGSRFGDRPLKPQRQLYPHHPGHGSGQPLQGEMRVLPRGQRDAYGEECSSHRPQGVPDVAGNNYRGERDPDTGR